MPVAEGAQRDNEKRSLEEPNEVSHVKEIALYALDIAQNSITARARHLDIALEEGREAITLTIADDGTGMSPELLARVSDPFTTTRTTRKMGLGIPLLRLAAEQTGGRVSIESTLGVGTTVTAVFCPGHIDCPPVGDMAGTVTLLVQGAPELELAYHTDRRGGRLSRLDTGELRAVLGPEVSLAEPEVVALAAGLRPGAGERCSEE